MHWGLKQKKKYDPQPGWWKQSFVWVMSFALWVTLPCSRDTLWTAHIVFKYSFHKATHVQGCSQLPWRSTLPGMHHSANRWHSKIRNLGQRDRTRRKVLGLHELPRTLVCSFWIPGTIYGPMSTPGVTPETESAIAPSTTVCGPQTKPRKSGNLVWSKELPQWIKTWFLSSFFFLQNSLNSNVFP